MDPGVIPAHSSLIKAASARRGARFLSAFRPGLKWQQALVFSTANRGAAGLLRLRQCMRNTTWASLQSSSRA